MTYTRAIAETVTWLDNRYALASFKPEGLYNFIAGQHAPVIMPWHTERKPQFYSIANAPHASGVIEFCFASDEMLHPESMIKGTTIELAPAAGEFRTHEDDLRRVYVAGGSGIAPLRAMIQAQLRRKDATPFSIIYGAESERLCPYREEMAALSEMAEQVTFAFQSSEDLLSAVERAASQDRAYYLCGPPAMLDAVRERLQTKGVGEEQIRTEF